MSQLFSNLSERRKLLLFSLIVCVFTILVTYFVGGNIAAIGIASFIIIFLLITRLVWRPKDHGKNRIRLYSLAIMAAAVTFPEWGKYIQRFIDASLSKYFPDYYSQLKIVPEASPYFSLALLALVIIWINYMMRDKTAMIIHTVDVEKDFPEKNYKSSLERYCRVVRKTIDDLDLETNWSADSFTPLDAEVESRRNNGSKKKITDLLKAIKNDHDTKVFLVLGDPGSGKSVALRKLCKDLLNEVHKTGKVPVYINLKEWYIKKKWSESNPPTSEQLYKFILTQLKGKDVFADQFLKKYFDKMMETGRLFIILDSFDEIPMVLDEKENSWLIDKLSEVIYYTLAGANNSRGILSSRFFRRPTNKFVAKTKLIIRPFTDEKISTTLRKSININEELVRKLFNKQKELIPVARNPFANSLIANYASENDNRLPNNQAELYEDIIYRRLKVCEEKIIESKISIQEVLDFAESVSSMMFQSYLYGLEMPIKDIKELLPSKKVDEIITILEYARIARVGRGRLGTFSFVHRRFNEYFVSKRLLSKSDSIPKVAIPHDSRWRDALVLYCEIAPYEAAKEIANFCWQEIKKIRDGNLDLSEDNSNIYVQSMHCLRFLIEAFRSRKECLVDFQNEFEEFILSKIPTNKNQTNLLETKLIIEATGIIAPEEVDKIIIPAFDMNNDWISETAINSCKYFPELSNNLDKKIIDYFRKKPQLNFLQEKATIITPLKYSDAFKRVYINLRKIYIFYIMSFIGLSFLFFVSPMLGLFLITLSSVTNYIYIRDKKMAGLVLLMRVLILYTLAIILFSQLFPNPGASVSKTVFFFHF